MNAKSSEPAKKDTWKWWYWILAGVGAGALAAFEYQDLTQFEISGGTRRMHSVLALAYNTMGKWGVVGALGALGVVAVAIGLYTLFSGEDATPDEASP